MIRNRNYFATTAAWSAFALAAVVPATVAHAQTAAEPASDEIVIVGYRAQNQQAVAAKRDSEQIAEFLTTDVIGQLPDYNISDSFRRLPGVQTVFDEDEGRYVAVRGLNPNFTMGSLDDSGIATAERQNRQLNMEAIPTTAVKRLEVFKSRTPDLDGNAIGGSVNLVTRSAFDHDGLYAVLQGFVGYNDSRDVPGKAWTRKSDDGANFRFDGTISTTFGDRDQFGVLFTGAFSRKRRDQERQLPQAYAATAGTFGIPVSTGFRTSSYPNSVDRWGGTLKLEWRPVESFRTGLTYTYYRQDDNELRYNHELTLPSRPATPGTTYTQNANGGLNVASATGYTLFNDFPIKKPLTVAQADFEWDLADRQSLKGRVSYSEAQFLEASNETRFSFASSTTNAGVYNNVNGTPSYVFNDPAAATFNQPSAYRFTSYQPYRDDSDDYVYEGQLDYAYNTERGSEGWGFGAGVKYRDNTRDFDTGQTLVNPSTSNTLTLDQFLKPTNYRSFYAPGKQLFIDFDKFIDYFFKNPSQFTVDSAGTALNATRRDYVVEEKIAAAYGLARYADNRNTLIFGGRFEKTETDVDGYRVTGSVVQPISKSGDYDHFLPSVNYIRRLNEQLKFRAAYYKAIGRPSPSDLGSNETVSTSAGTVTRGNVNLQPREADNYDLALEYYFPGGQGIASAGVFWKDISNDIFTATDGTTTINGQTFTVVQPRNLSSSELFGIELQLLQNRLDFLPGRLSNFGVSANFTYIDGKSTLPNGTTFNRLQGQASEQGNFALFYEEGPFRARATYAYTGRFYTAISDTNPLDNRYDKEWNQVDLQARWDFGRYEVIGEVRNLTDENRVNYQTGGLARDLNFFGRQFWVGVAFKPW